MEMAAEDLSVALEPAGYTMTVAIESD